MIFLGRINQSNKNSKSKENIIYRLGFY